jgi:serine/threonine/tyrosine-interacting-like protein 1
MFQPSIELIDCQSLYNILNEGFEWNRITDENYLYLLDCRDRADYNESHIICAKRIKRHDNGTFKIPYEASLECRNTIVVYDSNTSDLNEGDAVECAKILYGSKEWIAENDNSSKNTVRVLKGGYELFSRKYPFLRTQQIIYMPRELEAILSYPSEIIPELLYIGNLSHAHNKQIQKDLKINAYVSCCLNDQTHSNSFEIKINDDSEASIQEYLTDVCSFIDTNILNQKKACLVYSDLGISRSAAVVIAYLVYSQRLTLQEAFQQVLQYRHVQPQLKFLKEIDEKFIKK